MPLVLGMNENGGANIACPSGEVITLYSLFSQNYEGVLAISKNVPGAITRIPLPSGQTYSLNHIDTKKRISLDRYGDLGLMLSSNKRESDHGIGVIFDMPVIFKVSRFDVKNGEVAVFRSILESVDPSLHNRLLEQ